MLAQTDWEGEALKAKKLTGVELKEKWDDHDDDEEKNLLLTMESSNGKSNGVSPRTD